MKIKPPIIFNIANSILLLAMLSSCDHEFIQSGVDPSFVSAEVIIQKNNNAENDKVTIDPDKTRRVSQWFEKHRSGWSINVATPPLVSEMQMNITYADGHNVNLNIFTGDKYPGWRGTIIKGGADISVQKFPDEDFISLLEIIRK
jgi:hypothetical protein